MQASEPSSGNGERSRDYAAGKESEHAAPERYSTLGSERLKTLAHLSIVGSDECVELAGRRIISQCIW